VLVIQPRRNRAIEAARKSHSDLIKKGAAEQTKRKGPELE
jgi:hypothetical protein